MSTLQPYQHPYQQQYQQQYEPAPAPAPTPVPGPSAFTRAVPVIVSTAACTLGYVLHHQGGAHSIGDAAVTGAISAACLWAGHTLSGPAAKYIPASGIAAAYGLGGGLAGVAVIGYASAPVFGLIAWLAGTVVAYALAASGWSRRTEKREVRAHERDLALIQENAATQRTQIETDGKVAVAKELGAAWAAEQVASVAERRRMQEFNERYPSSVPMFGAVPAPAVVLGMSTTPRELDVADELEKLTGGAAGVYDQQLDGLELPHWLTDPDSQQ